MRVLDVTTQENFVQDEEVFVEDVVEEVQGDEAEVEKQRPEPQSEEEVVELRNDVQVN